MAKSYRKSSDDMRELMEEVLEKYHPQLHSLTPKIDMVDVYETSLKPALMVRGAAAYACIRSVPLKDRSMGRGDIEITFDIRSINEWSDRRKKALIDHELYHIEIKRNKDGQISYDDLHRPIFTMRDHDREFGWFDAIARRWGADSVESNQAFGMVTDGTFKELYLDPAFNKKNGVVTSAPDPSTVPHTSPMNSINPQSESGPQTIRSNDQ